MYLFLQHGPDLRIDNIQTSDSGTYICLVGRINIDIIEHESKDSSSVSSDEISNEIDFSEALTIILNVRSTPGPLTRLCVRLSTILGVLMWEFSSNNSGVYPIKSFTAEFRELCIDLEQSSVTEMFWQRLDPQNIPANVVTNTQNSAFIVYVSD